MQKEIKEGKKCQKCHHVSLAVGNKSLPPRKLCDFSWHEKRQKSDIYKSSAISTKQRTQYKV